MSILQIFFLLGIVETVRRLLVMAISGTLAESELQSMRDCVVEVDIGGEGNWAAIESWAITLTPTRGTVPTSEEKTLDALNHTGYGTAGNAAIAVQGMATHTSNSPLVNLYSQLGQPVDIRWSETGLATDTRYYTSAGVLTECNAPGFDANSNQLTKFNFNIVASDILAEEIPTA